jgi:hypothetical protein
MGRHDAHALHALRRGVGPAHDVADPSLVQTGRSPGYSVPMITITGADVVARHVIPELMSHTFTLLRVTGETVTVRSDAGSAVPWLAASSPKAGVAAVLVTNEDRLLALAVMDAEATPGMLATFLRGAAAAVAQRN